ncbi:LppA-related lipoprotein [Mesomycoplasma dispar]|nr:LppA family lipoprotein [Mesomycoplasma dispar]
METMKKKKWMLLFSNFSAIFLLSAGCSVASNVPLSKKEKVENPNNNNNNNENQKPGDSNGEIKNPILSVKPKPDPLPPKAPEKPTEPPEKPDITVEKPKKEKPPAIDDDKKQPVLPDPNKGKTQEKPIDSGKNKEKPKEKPIVKVFNPREEQKKSDIELARLKGHLSTLPNTLYVTNSMQSSYPQTIIYKGKNDYKNFSYVNFVDPIEGLDEAKYDAKLDFSNAKTTGNSNNNKDPIEDVLLVLISKEDLSLRDSKKVKLLYQKGEKKYTLKAKNLPDGFKNIFPSFLAFALLNKDKDDVISLPFFNKLDFILPNQNFGVGLKDAFVEFSSSDNSDEVEKNKYGFDIVSAQPDDENGKLKLNLQLWKIVGNTDVKEFFSKIESVEFSGLAKNSSNVYQIALAKKDLELKLLSDELKKTLLEKDLNDFTKNAFLKELLDKLYVEINADVNNKWVKLSETKSEKWLVFPQIQYVNLDSTQLTNKLELKKEGTKISWSLELESFLLENGQTLTPKGEFLFGNKKIHKITGEFDLNQI